MVIKSKKLSTDSFIEQFVVAIDSHGKRKYVVTNNISEALKNYQDGCIAYVYELTGKFDCHGKEIE